MATYGQFVTYGPFTTAIGGGWKLYHYVAGTSTLKNVWTDRNKTTTAAQPLVADANGVVSFYADGLYRFVLKDANDVQLYEWDNVFYGSIESTNHAEGVALASASTLVLGGDGDYFHVTGTTTIAAITGTQPFVFLTFDSALTLTHSNSLVLKGGVDHPTVAGETLLFVNDGSNVFRELDNNTPTKHGAATWTGAHTFSGQATFNSAVAFSSTVTGQTPSITNQLTTKQFVEKRIADSTALVNGYISTAVASNALTVSLKVQSGSDPSSDEPVYVAFRSTTAANSSLNVRSVTAPLSVVLSAGSTMGFIAAQLSRLYVVALDNAGTVELALYHPLNGTDHKPLDETGLYSSTAEGGAGGAGSAQTLYSTTARTNVPIAVLGYIDIQTGGTAGNWSNAPIHVQVMTTSTPRSGQVIQRLLSSSSAYASGSTIIPLDDSLPQNSEGTEFMTQAITPKHAANLLFVSHVGVYSASATVHATVALFRDSTASAVAAAPLYLGAVDASSTVALIYQTQAATTTSTTFKIRGGPSSAATLGFNGRAGARLYNGACYSALAVMEMFT